MMNELCVMGCLRACGTLKAIIVVLTADSSFLRCASDASIESNLLSPDTVLSLLQSKFPSSLPAGGIDQNTIQITFDHADTDKLWLGYSGELDLLDRWWFEKNSPALWISGPGGCGKTSLARTWIRAFREIGYRTPQSFNALDMYPHEGQDACLLLGEVAKLWERAHHRPPGDLVRTNDSIPAIEAAMRAYGVGAGDLLIFESPECLNEDQLFITLRALLCIGYRIIVTSRVPTPIDCGIPFKSIAISKLNDRDVEMLVHRLFEQAPDPSLERRLVQAVQGNPLATSLTIERVNKYGSWDVKKIINDMLEGYSRQLPE